MASLPAPNHQHSYLVLLGDELAELAVGVPTYDSLTGETFDLHAYNLFSHGDIIAIEKMMNIKGHNSLSACRSCQIKGVRGSEKIYYYPLSAPCDEHEQPASRNPRDLPLQTHEHFLDVIADLDKFKATPSTAEKIAKFHGNKGLPALHRVGSDFARSNPWDFMHLLFENNIPNLVALWSGKFKGLDTGSQDYEISQDVWDEIWKETAEATVDIPAAFSRSLAAGPTKFTVEEWCFWFVYLAPTLLEGRFADPKYHAHACDLSDIIKKNVSNSQFTHTELGNLEAKIIKWVQTYERHFYYQYKEDQLCTCPLLVHGLLHVAPDIRFCGPSWTTWTFYMDRYCGFLKASLRSRRFPWANLNNRVLNFTYLEQIRNRYDLADELEIYGRHSRGPSKTEKIYEDCEDQHT